MNSKSRQYNSIRNIVVGVGSQITILLMSFLGRTVFINTLGAEYLGINGLYNNILTILSLAELGIGNVMIYSLYKPIANNDKSTISAMLNYFKKIYMNIALIIFVIGLAIIPFLDLIVDSSISKNNLILYYLLFLLNSVASYIVVYKTILINADQKLYIVKTIQTGFIILKEVLQIIILLYTTNYILYLSVVIVCTILNNFYLSIKTDKLYPFIKTKQNFSKVRINAMHNDIKSAFVYKIGAVIMNNTDNILISTIVGTLYVGYYSNYNLLVTAVTTFVGILVQALFSSIGDFNADGDMEKSYKLFNVLLLVFHWLAAWCSICFLLVFNDFIEIWIGNNYVLGMNVVSAIVINFYLQNIINPVWMYRETMGLFKQIKYIMLISSMINIILSIYAGIQWGLVGILLSTAISRLLTTVWYEPKLLFNTKFCKPINFYWKRQIKYLIVTIITSLGLIILFRDTQPSLGLVFIKILLGFFIMSMAFILTNYKSDEFLMLKSYILQFKKN